MPLEIASFGDAMAMGLPSNRTSPETARETPNRASASSADDFAGVQRERRSGGGMPRGGESAHVEHRGAGVGSGRIRIAGYVAPHHRPDHPIVGELVLGQLADIATVPQHDRAVGHRDHLSQTVGDIDDGHALGAQLGYHFQQAGGLGGGQRRRGFVEDQNARILRQRPCDFHQLSVGDGKIGHHRGGRTTQPDAVHRRLRRAMHGRGIQKPALARFAPQADVSRDVEVVEDGQFLMNERHTLATCLRRGRQGAWNAGDHDRSRIGCDHAAEDLHQGGLAGAVLTQQRDHLARRNRKGNGIQRDDAGVSLRYPDHR